MNPALTPWLLDSAMPSIRYLTLKHLVGLDDADERLRAARLAIMSCGPVPAILAGQGDDGHWTHERSYYTPKFTSSHWSMVLLTELATDAQDDRVQRGAESMLRRTEDELRGELAARRMGSVCFWGNLLRYALYAGLQDDARVQRVVQYVALQADGSSDTRGGLPIGWGCPLNGNLPCAWGAARALWGLAALPQHLHGDIVRRAMASAVALLLEEGRLTEGSYPSSGRPHADWRRANAILFYQADVLFVLRALGDVGALARPEAGPGLAWLRARASGAGRWRGAHPYARRTWPLFASRDDVDRWVSLHAVMVLHRAALLREEAAG